MERPLEPNYEEQKMVTVEIECSFKSYVEVPEEITNDYQEMEKYIKRNYSAFELTEEADTVNIEWIQK